MGQIVFIHGNYFIIACGGILFQNLFYPFVFGIKHDNIDFFAVFIEERSTYFPITYMGAYHNYAGVSIQYVQKCLIVLELEMIFVCHPIADGYFVNQYLPQPVVIFQ